MIFLDTASTTKVKSKVKAEVNKYFNTNYANPLANYEYASEPLEAINKSRRIISDMIHSDPEEIYFTSGGSESNNMVIKGVAFQYYKENKKSGHIITTQIEHHSILNACKELEEIGIANVTYLEVNNVGKVNPKDLEEAIRPNTILISIGWGNNEIGTIQDIDLLADIAEKSNILFHTDAVQVYGKLPIKVSKIALLSASGHKWGSPKGIGFLYVKNGVHLAPLINGGHQENGIRGGTHNVPYIAGMGVASRIAEINRTNNYNHETTFKFTLWQKLHNELPLVTINGDATNSLPNILNLNFYPYKVRGEVLLAFLNEHHIYVSTGSACATGEPSHVLEAIGLSEDEVDCSIRLSFNENNKIDDIDKIVSTIKNGVELIGG